MKIEVRVAGKRVYVEGPGEPRIRMIPLSAHEFWVEQLQSVASFETLNNKVTRIVFQIGEHQLTATRID